MFTYSRAGFRAPGTLGTSIFAAFALALAIAMMLSLPATAHAALVSGFDVQISSAPPVDIQPGLGECVPNGLPPTELTCTINYANADTLSSTLNGTVTNTSTGVTGTIQLICAWNLQMHVKTAVAYPAMSMVFSALSGGGDQNCSWDMNFTDHSTLSGTAIGNVAMDLVPGTPPTDLKYSGGFGVTVINGTGYYAGLVGTGSFIEIATMLLPTTAPAGSYGGLLSLRRSATSSSRLHSATAGSGMTLKLKKGPPRAAIYAPGTSDKITSSSTQNLRVLGTKGTSCKAVAIKGHKQVKLGSAKDGSPRDGRVIITKKLSSSLAKGTWKLKATCMVPRKGKKPIKSIAFRTIVRT